MKEFRPLTAEDVEEIIQENTHRRSALPELHPYNPLVGDSTSPRRKMVKVKWEQQVVSLPCTMIDSSEFRQVKTTRDYKLLRYRHDFEYWAAECVKIRHKQTGQRVPFYLNAPQRRVLEAFETDRLAGRPLRFIMLKARQWGGSTLVQMYFAWIQCVLQENWNSLICAHVKDTAAGIRGMYDDVLAEYPENMWESDEKPKFTVWQKSANTRELTGRGCKVTIGSSFGQDSVRGLDFSMAHLSEVAFWKDTERMTPADFIRSVCGGIPSVPLSMIVLESTANGVANYFHTLWTSATEGKNAYRQIFVPWYEIEMYRTECQDAEAFVRSWNAYERGLWEQGLTIEMIQWYHDKRMEFVTDSGMMSEYPTNPVEAFANTGSGVFSSKHIEQLRRGCCDPMSEDELERNKSVKTLLDTPGADGQLKIWELPDEKSSAKYKNRYVAAVDVGGRSLHSDYSVIAVFDRMPGGILGRPALVAQWRGHCDHDLLGYYAAKMSRVYNNAHLVIESNTLESATEGAAQYILEDLNATYRNLYVRWSRDNSGDAVASPRVGFHTNRSTKAAIITNLIGYVRNCGYQERDSDACNEMATYEMLPSGSYAAHKGFHDDILMTRAIALYVIATMPSPSNRTEMMHSLGVV